MSLWIEHCLVNQVWRSLHAGEQLASIGLGWKMDPSPWISIFWLITKFHTLHITFFFCCPRELRRSLCSSPHAWCCPVLLPCCLVGTDFTFFANFWVKIAAILQALGTWRLVLLYQVFQHCTWIHKCVKERKEVFQWLVCMQFFKLGIK